MLCTSSVVTDYVMSFFRCSISIACVVEHLSDLLRCCLPRRVCFRRASLRPLHSLFSLVSCVRRASVRPLFKYFLILSLPPPTSIMENCFLSTSAHTPDPFGRPCVTCQQRLAARGKPSCCSRCHRTRGEEHNRYCTLLSVGARTTDLPAVLSLLWSC